MVVINSGYIKKEDVFEMRKGGVPFILLKTNKGTTILLHGSFGSKFNLHIYSVLGGDFEYLFQNDIKYGEVLTEDIAKAFNVSKWEYNSVIGNGVYIRDWGRLKDISVNKSSLMYSLYTADSSRREWSIVEGKKICKGRIIYHSKINSLRDLTNINWQSGTQLMSYRLDSV